MSRKNLLLIALPVCLIILALAIFGITRLNSETTSLKGIDDCSVNIHEKVVKNLQTKTYGLIKMANDYNKLETKSKYGSEIRNGSCEEKAVNITKGLGGKAREVTTTSVIVDAPDAKQSWKITFDWIVDDTEIDIDLGSLTPECLPKEQLIYGEFNCEKALSKFLYGTDKYDPILQYMPYTGKAFDLTYNPDTKQVAAKILVPESQKNNTALIENNKAAVLRWFKRNNLDPNKYTITYQVAQQ